MQPGFSDGLVAHIQDQVGFVEEDCKGTNTNRLTKYFSPGPGAPFKLCKRQLERKSVTSRYHGSTISG